jgi:hypothetical protein
MLKPGKSSDPPCSDPKSSKVQWLGTSAGEEGGFWVGFTNIGAFEDEVLKPQTKWVGLKIGYPIPSTGLSLCSPSAEAICWELDPIFRMSPRICHEYPNCYWWTSHWKMNFPLELALLPLQPFDQDFSPLAPKAGASLEIWSAEVRMVWCPCL